MMETKLYINDKTICWFISLMAISNLTIFTFGFEVSYYAFLFLTMIYSLYKSKVNNINITMLLLYIACTLSIILNEIPTFFKSWERLASFILITALISPLFDSTILNRIRIRLFQYSQYILQIIVIISFILYLLGINLSGRKDFSGITNQSMLLAPIAANVFITSLFNLTNQKNKKAIIFKYFLLGAISSILILFLTASRSALVSALASSFIYIIIIYRNKLHYLIKLLISLFILLIISLPLWTPYLNNLSKKNSNSLEAGGITSSRDDLWNSRINEFNSSPLFGIGFASISIESGKQYFNKNDGKVETGSSWLNILSMTGVFGIICFIIIWSNSIFLLFNNLFYHNYVSSYLLSLLFFWSLHMFAEGYIYACGSILFFFLWLLIGLIFTVGKHSKYMNLI